MGRSLRVRIFIGSIALVVGAVFSAACTERSPRPVPFDTVLVSEAQIAAHPALGVGTEVLRSRVRAALERTGRLDSLPRAAPDDRAWQVTVELARVRAMPEPRQLGEDESHADARAEVVVELQLTRGATERMRAEGSGVRRFVSGEPDLRGEAFAGALTAALDEAARGLAVSIELSSRPVQALIADLKGPEPQRRDLALRVLADRRSGEAVEAILLLLQDPDRDMQLRATGALVEIGDRRAVPALIEATAHKDPSFLAQVAYALGDLGGTEAEAYLFTAANGHPEPSVALAAADALGTLRERRARLASQRSAR